MTFGLRICPVALPRASRDYSQEGVAEFRDTGMVPQLRFIAANFRNPLWMSLDVLSRFLTRIVEYQTGVQLDNGELETMCDPQLVVDVVLNPLVKQHA